jgi:TRAP-type C4-dicarboxylate transport system permease small subunit
MYALHFLFSSNLTPFLFGGFVFVGFVAGAKTVTSEGLVVVQNQGRK